MIVILAKYFFLISFVIAGVFFLTLSKKDKKGMFVLASLSGVISLILRKIGSVLINDPRPFVVNHVTPLIAHSPDNGFPSDHTLLAMWLAMVVYFYNKKLGIILMVISLIVGTARVLALVHHPLDIFGSIVIAIIAVVVSKIAIAKFTKRK